MKMRKFILGVIAALGVAGVTWWQWPSVTDVQAAPTITAPTPTSIPNDVPITITGTSLGSHNLDIVWTGGPHGMIETAPVDSIFPPLKTTTGFGTSISATTLPPAGRAHIEFGFTRTGSKAIVGHKRSNDNGPGPGFEYVRADSFNEVYFSYWVYHHKPSTKNAQWQWKTIRVNNPPDGTTHSPDNVSNTTGEVYFDVHYTAPATMASRFSNPFCANPSCTHQTTPPACDITCPASGGVIGPCICNICLPCGFAFSSCGRAPLAAITWDADIWSRHEFHLKESSALDISDGTLQWWTTQGTNTTWTMNDFPGNFCSRRNISGDRSSPKPCQNVNAPPKWRYIVWENYYERQSSPIREEGDLYFDDIYMQFGSAALARVEIGNASTFAACTHREIQRPTAWSSTSVTFTSVFGTFNPGDAAWLYVVDNSGVASDGWPITLSCSAQASPNRDGSAASVVLNDSLTTAGTLTHEITSASAASGDTITVALKLTGPYSVTGFRAGIYFEQNDFANAVIEPVAFHGNLLGGTRVALTDPTAPARCVDDGCAKCPALELGGHHVRGVKWIQWAGSAVDVTAGVEVARIRFRAKNAGTSNIYWGCGNDVGQTEVQGYTGSNVRIFDTVGGGYTASGRGTFTQTTVGDITGLSPKFVQSVGTITVTGTWNPCDLWPLQPSKDFHCSEFAVGIGDTLLPTLPSSVPIKLWGSRLTGGVLSLIYTPNGTFNSVSNVRPGWTVTALDTVVTSPQCPTGAPFYYPNFTKKLRLQLCGPAENLTGETICTLSFTAPQPMTIAIDCDEAIPPDTETCAQFVDPVQHSLVWQDGTWLTVGEIGSWQGIPRLINIRHEAGHRRFFNWHQCTPQAP